MKYVKTFEQLDYSTPFGKAQALKITKKNNIANSNFKNEFFNEFPKGTKLTFKDREATYDLVLFDIKFDETGYKLIFKAENGKKIVISNPFQISEQDLEEISLLPVEITPESKEIVNKMLNK
jgi:hypothetical protein